MLTHSQRGLLGALAGSLLVWVLVLTGGIEVQIGRAKLPNFSSVEGMVDDRLGEKLLDQSKQQVDQRFSQERKAFGGDYSGSVSPSGNPNETLSTAQKKGETYATELAAQQRAALSAKLVQSGYNDLLQQHTGQLGKITEIQSKVNSIQGKVNQFKELYVKVKFLMGR
jgi:hypothetical protein